MRALYKDSQGELWVGIMNGLCRYDREKDRFTRYQHDPENLSSLAGNRVYAITEGHNATLWAASKQLLA
ncbi:MAG: hypothetical protein JSV38_06310 [Desulfobacterales bacterium]|nr:MAG: hypothetical protein JSV38_06310 [Desulfobacterales bacterium]